MSALEGAAPFTKHNADGQGRTDALLRVLFSVSSGTIRDSVSDPGSTFAQYSDF
jgi:hypothetical protein